MFLARDQHGLAFLRWVRHFLAIFIKVHEFLQNSVFSPRSVRFVVSALGAPMLSDCQQSARVCTKHCFQPKIRTFCQFRTGRILLQRLSAKCTSLYKTEFQARLRHVFERFSEKCTSLWKTAFSARDLDVSPFSHWVHHFLGIFSKINEFVQNSVSSARSARFGIFLPGTTLFSGFQQSARVCTKQKFSSRDQHVS